jgi:competence protein ComEA
MRWWRSFWDHWRRALGASAWAALGGKVAAYGAGFFALALVGSGGALRLLPQGGGVPAALVYGGASSAGSATHAEPPAETADVRAADAGAADAADAADAGGADAASPGGGTTADGKVVLNLATAEDLRRLPGIGPAKAAAILALRAKLKRFRKVEDLLRVKGIGRRSLQRLRPLVVLDPP